MSVPLARQVASDSWLQFTNRNAGWAQRCTEVLHGGDENGGFMDEKGLFLFIVTTWLHASRTQRALRVGHD